VSVRVRRGRRAARPPDSQVADAVHHGEADVELGRNGRDGGRGLQAARRRPRRRRRGLVHVAEEREALRLLGRRARGRVEGELEVACGVREREGIEERGRGEQEAPSPLTADGAGADSPLIMGTESLSAMTMSTKAMNERYVALRRLPSPVPSPTPNHRRVSMLLERGTRGRVDEMKAK
jgi:hypothetical protein